MSFGRFWWEGIAFGQNAHRHQAVAVLGMIATTIALLYAGRESTTLTVVLSLLLVASLFWYVVPGHAMIYGPHLFILGFIDLVVGLVRLVWRRWK